MKIKILASVLFALLLSAGPSRGQAEEVQSCTTRLINWESFEKTLSALRSVYINEYYDQLDVALGCLVDQEGRFLSGKSGAAAVYWFYRNTFPAPGLGTKDYVRVENWKNHNRDSKYAAFAAVRLKYAEAWNARGSDFANKTGEQRMALFKKTMLEAEAALLSEDNKLIDTPVSQNLLLAIALDSSETKTNPIDVFNAGIKKWPNYYDFYEVLLTRLVPKWGGSWEIVDESIKTWSAERSVQEGKSLYARLYYSVHHHGRGVDPQQTLVSWPVMKESLESLVSKYPTQKHRYIAASYACYFSDREFYARFRATEPEYVDRKSWLLDTDQEQCDLRFPNEPVR